MKEKANKREKKSMKSNTAIKYKDRIYHDDKAKSRAPLDLEEESLFGHINENLFKLEQNVEFFSFAVKEIEEITKQ